MSWTLRAWRFGFFAFGLSVASLAVTGCGARTSIEVASIGDDAQPPPFTPVDAGGDTSADGKFDGPKPDTTVDVSPDVKPDQILYDVVPDSKLCNPSNCAGCCDATNQCRTGLEANACGGGGFVCANCAQFGTSCNAVTHQCGATCDSTVCAVGCCKDGKCNPGTSNAECGIGGAACQQCPAGFTCDPKAHACVPAKCNPGTCSGCCDVGDACQSGSSSSACGVKGQPCVNCTAQGQKCDATTHTCVGGPSCGPGTCSGCCDPFTMQCAGGLQSWACGSGGQTCQSCGPNQSCVPTWGGGGMCEGTPPTCGPGLCPGCCDNSVYPPVCRPGTDTWACGMGGGGCYPCPMGSSCIGVPGGGGICEGPPPTCGPGTCSGCCNNSVYPPKCMPGVDPGACGVKGETCKYCPPGGKCVPNPGGGGTCAGTTDCGPWNCTGCCDPSSFPSQCRPGSEPWACGAKGSMCEYCGGPGQSCQPNPPPGGGTCVSTSLCGPGCTGCCDTTVYPPKCAPGLEPARCGYGGAKCENCSGPNQMCQPTPGGGGMCVGVIPECNPQNCAGCCDGMGNCLPGDQNKACGIKANKCIDCNSLGQICNPATGNCVFVPNCGPGNCSGCCTLGGQCRPGQSNTQCGKLGVVCENCLQTGGSCIGGSCSGQPNCPAPYQGCPSYLSTPKPVQSLGVCPQSELDQMKAMCTGDPPPPSCQDWFQKEQVANPGCYKCLYQFLGPNGFATCLAPFLDPSCNHQLSCSLDCVSVACSQCTSQYQQQCQNDVFMGSGTCSGYMQGLYCAQTAINGPGAFCNSTGDGAQWLRVVGNHYCGTGSP